jgi:flagellar hook-length control protein FliK
VLEHLRAAASQASGRTDAAGDANVTPAAVARLVVPDAAASTPPPPVSVSTAAPLPGVAGSPQGQRSTPDSSGEQMPGFTFGGHAAPRAAAPVTAVPSVTPNFGALVNTTYTPDAVPVETTAQIVQAIRLQMLRDGGEAHIRLDPRQFGDMTVRIKVEQGQVTARVEADAPVVREWLQSNQHVLRQSLAGQQLTLDRLEVHEPAASSQGRRDESSARDGARDEQRHQRRRRPETGELFEVVA